MILELSISAINSLTYLYFEVLITIVCQLFKCPKKIAGHEVWAGSENFMSDEKFQLPQHL